MTMTPYWQDAEAGLVVYHGDNRLVLPELQAGSFDLVLTDPPYLTSDAKVPIRGRGVSRFTVESESIGLPWGYSLHWVDLCARLNPAHWVVFAHYKMLGGLCSCLDPQAVFVWRKSNAPRMARPVPRLDCEFIVWSRARGAPCENMGDFDSLVIDVPQLQAGCMATERILELGSKKAAHPCQKPLAVVRPFIHRLRPKLVLDPFLGSGTTAVAAKLEGVGCVGIEQEERYIEIAIRRLEATNYQEVLPFHAPPVAKTGRVGMAEQVSFEEPG